jgi:tol-pal system protein YbgF
MGEQEAYQAAYGLVRERQFSDALTAFAAFLGEYPFGRFAPNAHYWLGELYLVVEPVDPESARQNFQVLLDQYPNDRKVPDALYKLGRVHALKGNQERSREYLQRVISEYGGDGHPAAQLAKDFLDSQ